jgi:predicted outer membrane repeat protein
MVTTTNDSGAGSLRGQVAAAASGDTIEFASSIMGQTITLTSGEIALAKNLTINGTTEKITVSGGFTSRIFEITSGTVTIESLTLSNGTAAGGNGGAVLVDSGATLTLKSASLSNNTATLSSTSTNGFGGAVENDGSLTVTSSTLQNNNAQASGGAIDSFSGSAGTLTVTSTKFYGNVAGNFGGAISTADPTTLTSDTFGGSKAGQGNVGANGGGAVDAFGTSGTTALTLTKSTFTDNKVSSGGFGGAVSTVDNLSDTFDTYTGNSAPFGGGAIDYFVRNLTTTAFSATETIQDDTFTGNSAEGGGAVYSNINVDAGTATVTISDNTFFQNTALGSTSFVYGGGLYIKHITASTSSTSGSITATVADDTFFQNTSKNHGGGVAVVDTVGAGGGANTVALVSLTVFQNTAVVDGGGLYVNLVGGSTLSVDNTILDGNSINAAGPQDLTVAGGSASITDDGFNLVGTSDTQFTALTDISNNTTGLATSLASNGAAAGVPKTLALSTSSVGHDTGDQTLAGTKDERGKTRQVNKVSIGAEDPDAI